MCLLQGILVYIHEDGSLFFLAWGKQPEGLVHQQVLQAVVCETCKARLVTNRLGGAGDPKTSNTRPGEDLDTLFFPGNLPAPPYSMEPYLTVLAVRVTPVYPLYHLSLLCLRIQRCQGFRALKALCDAHAPVSRPVPSMTISTTPAQACGMLGVTTCTETIPLSSPA